MSTQQKVRTLIDVDRKIWASVRMFATINSLKTNAALDVLLTEGLKKKGY